MILSYYNNRWEYPNLEWDNDASLKMINVSLLKDKIGAVINDNNIPTDPSWLTSFEWYKNSLTGWSYWYYIMTKNTISKWWFALLAKTKTEEASNFLGSFYYMFNWDLKDFKTCESVKRSEYAWLSSCNPTIHDGVCTYCDDEDLRYVYIF